MERMNTVNRLAASKKQGFTMVEVMLSLGVFGLVMGMSLSFLSETGRINFISAEKNDINREVRNIVDRMALEGKQSNVFLVYPSAKEVDRNHASDRQRPNEAGDCILLVYKAGYAEMLDLGVDPLVDPRPVTRLIMYYRAGHGSGESATLGPVRRWEKDYSKAPITDAEMIRNIEQLIPEEETLGAESKEVVELSEGLADGRLFYNYQNRTVMINGKIVHGNRAIRVTDTYNFSISPRG